MKPCELMCAVGAPVEVDIRFFLKGEVFNEWQRGRWIKAEKVEDGYRAVVGVRAKQAPRAPFRELVIYFGELRHRQEGDDVVLFYQGEIKTTGPYYEYEPAVGMEIRLDWEARKILKKWIKKKA